MHRKSGSVAPALKNRGGPPRRTVRGARNALQKAGPTTYRRLGSGLGGAEEIGKETIAGGFDAGVVFDERNAHHVEIEADGGAGAF